MNAPPIDDVTTVSDVRAVLAALHSREASITAKLDIMLQSQSHLSQDLVKLDLLRARLGTQAPATRAISKGMLADAASTAHRLTQRVKTLDLEKRRVDETLNVVEQVAELKACVHGVVGSMGAPQDWEAAAEYIMRASKISEDIVKTDFASHFVPSIEVPDPPLVPLEAVEAGDIVGLTRYFKLFPLIGKSDAGLNVYGQYVCLGVADAARARLKDAPTTVARRGTAGTTGTFYVNALNKLFEHIAHIIAGHEGLVEQHYGQGKMVVVMERLQMEADVQGGILLDSWSDDRSIGRRLTDVKSSPCPLRVQNFMVPQRSGVDLTELDGLLTEIAAILGRWALYTRFIAGKCTTMPEFLANSNLSHKISTNLIIPYNTIATFFLCRSVEKTFQMDESPSGLSLRPERSIDASPPFIILAVDDLIFIVNATILKSLATTQEEIVANIITTVDRVLGSDFIAMIRRKMRDEAYPKALIQGALPPEDKTISFIVLINSLDMATEYLARIVTTNLGVNLDLENFLTQTSPIRDAFPVSEAASTLAHSLSKLLKVVTAKATELRNEGLHVLFNNVLQPRLRPIISDAFRNVDYSLTREQLGELATDDDQGRDAPDHVGRTFEHSWDQLMRPLARVMTSRGFSALLDITARHLAQKVLEKRLWAYAGRTSALGALRMERDFSHIASAVAQGDYTVKRVFAKLSQILLAVNMEQEEWDDMHSNGDGHEEVFGLLTAAEKVKAREFVCTNGN
ncbi:COG4-domain-containing protein [Tothia fuscella]|uniref:Conserved oligomeric Golgi complex subunit 4 n=1 Tax=Tothia fuscella TaxID=1048955 RepID=A0A9P4TV91_9PEZI|nr:COG4-domain-containing protein [Tothia fuscella]